MGSLPLASIRSLVFRNSWPSTLRNPGISRVRKRRPAHGTHAVAKSTAVTMSIVRSGKNARATAAAMASTVMVQRKKLAPVIGQPDVQRRVRIQRCSCGIPPLCGFADALGPGQPALAVVAGAAQRGLPCERVGCSCGEGITHEREGSTVVLSNGKGARTRVRFPVGDEAEVRGEEIIGG